MTSYREILDQDTRSVPVELSPAYVDLGTSGVDRRRYLSREFHDLESARLWPRVWQMACREEVLVRAGDHVVYDVGNLSLIVIRGNDGAIRAFHNSCLHRGTQLRVHDGNVPALRCPFHGFTWDLQGALTFVPCADDFPHVDPAE